MKLRAFALIAVGLAGACTLVPEAQGEQVSAPAARAIPAAAADAVAPSSAPLPPAKFAYDGRMTQGGWIRGVVPVGTARLMLNDVPVAVAADGTFIAAFDRDAGASATLVSQRSDGSSVSRLLAIAPRDWRIEHIDVPRRKKGPTEAFLAIRRPELERIGAARAHDTGSNGWRQSFVWPVTGRISGHFGSQRVYQGEAGSYHSGVDIAPGAGAPFVAPADGVVVLAAPEGFSLEGKLLIIDHGMGLNSAFLHAQSLAVAEGDRVKQGQLLGRVGMSGRATGPNLHWSLMWHDARLDPLLFTGPMPGT